MGHEKQILLTRYSSPEVIKNFLWKQLHMAFIDFEFELDFDKFFYLIFKYKKIEIK